LPEEPANTPPRLVYGEYWTDGGFALLEETLAVGLASEIEAVKMCTTVGEARRLEPELKFTYVPDSDFEDEAGDPLPDDAPYAWYETTTVHEGDWPPIPGGWALDFLPGELLGKLTIEAGRNKATACSTALI
jgi:hypothetical protein